MDAAEDIDVLSGTTWVLVLFRTEYVTLCEDNGPLMIRHGTCDQFGQFEMTMRMCMHVPGLETPLVGTVAAAIATVQHTTAEAGAGRKQILLLSCAPVPHTHLNHGQNLIQD